MTQPTPLSSCCQASVTEKYYPDDMTRISVCSKCDKICPVNASAAEEELKDLLSKFCGQILNNYQDIYLMEEGPHCEEILFPVLDKALKEFFELPNDGLIRKNHVAEFLTHVSTLSDSTLREVEKMREEARRGESWVNDGAKMIERFDEIITKHLEK